MRLIRFICIPIILLCILSIDRDSLGAEKKFPVKPVQVIIPFSPGVTDSNLRPFIEKMSEYLGAPVTFTYKPGSGGATGAAFVASAKPDGYTLLGASQTPIVLLPISEKDAGYTWESFAPISSLAEGILVFAVQSSAPWKNLQELVAEAKQNPNKISYAVGGVFDGTNLATRIFADEAGIKLNMIPCSGGAAIVTALLGGHVNAAVTGLSVLLPHIKAGSLRGLAVLNKERSEMLSDVPTFLEQGYSVKLPNAYGLVAPKGTPPEVINTVYLALKKMIEIHQVPINGQLNRLGSRIGFMGPAEYQAFLKDSYVSMEKMVRTVKK